MFYDLEKCKKLAAEYNQLNQQHNDLDLFFRCYVFNEQRSSEYVKQGFLRRVHILKRCIHNIFNICPVSKSEKTTDDELKDLAINLQSFIANCFGCMDNLAWIWVFETQFDYGQNDMDVSFFKSKIKNKLSPDFKKHLDDLEIWRNNLKEFRDALAHKIPLYVPSTEGSNFLPIMITSIVPPNEPVNGTLFHAQLLDDWNKILELSNVFIQELNYQKQQ